MNETPIFAESSVPLTEKTPVLYDTNLCVIVIAVAIKTIPFTQDLHYSLLAARADIRHSYAQCEFMYDMML